MLQRYKMLRENPNNFVTLQHFCHVASSYKLTCQFCGGWMNKTMSTTISSNG